MTNYGVVLCPGCKRPKGVDLDHKTAKCVCGRRLSIKELKVLYRAQDGGQLSEAIGRIAARLEGREEELTEGLWAKGSSQDEEDLYPEITALAVQVAGEGKKTMVVLQGLGERLGSFTMEEARDVLDHLGLGDPEGWIEKLLRENVLYEPRKGTYRLV